MAKLGGSPSVWVDGQAQADIPAGDRGLNYGDGVFRTLLCWQSKVQMLDRQLEKISLDAQALGLPSPDQSLLEGELNTLAAGLQNGVIRLTLTAGDGDRGYRRPASPRLRRIARCSALPDWSSDCWQNGIAVRSGKRVWNDDVFPGIKHLNRLPQVLSRMELEAGEQEVLAADRAGFLISGSMSNVFVYQDGRWQTPALRDCGIAGVMRERLLECSRQHGPDIQIERISRQLAEHGAEAAFVCNSVIGLWPVRQWQQRDLLWPAPAQREFACFQSWLNHPLNQKFEPRSSKGT